MLKTPETPYGTPHQASPPAFQFSKQQHSYSKSAHCIPKQPHSHLKICTFHSATAEIMSANSRTECRIHCLHSLWFRFAKWFCPLTIFNFFNFIRACEISERHTAWKYRSISAFCKCLCLNTLCRFQPFRHRKTPFSWWKKAVFMVKKRRKRNWKTPFLKKKTAFSDGENGVFRLGHGIFVFQEGKMRKISRRFAISFSCFSVKETECSGFDFCKCNEKYAFSDAWMRRSCIELPRIEKEKGEIRVEISPFADCEQA